MTLNERMMAAVKGGYEMDGRLVSVHHRNGIAVVCTKADGEIWRGFVVDSGKTRTLSIRAGKDTSISGMEKLKLLCGGEEGLLRASRRFYVEDK